MDADLALVGGGYWGRNLARNFLALGALRRLCDRSPETLAAYGAEYAGVGKSDSLEAILSDPAVTKVAIATPATTHHEIARAALRAGKDVFVEKPLCLRAPEARELADLARTSGRILMVGHLLQYHPCIVRLREILRRGDLGRLQYLSSNRLNLGKIRKEENALWSFAPHDLSVILSLAGDRLPDQVRCVGEAYLSPGVADTTMTLLRFSGGVRAHVYVTWLHPFKEQKLAVVGSEGMAVFDDLLPWAKKLALYRKPVTWREGNVPVPTRGEPEYPAIPEAEPLKEECAHFLHCCRTRSAPVTDGEEALRVLQVLQAAQSSLERDGDAAAPAVSAPEPSYFAHPTAVIDPGSKIGAGAKIWHFSHVMPDSEIGERCNLGQNVVVSPGVRLGRNVKVQNNVSLYEGVVCEDDVFLGPSMVFTNVSNPRSAVVRKHQYEKTLVRRGATIGANATIVCGSELGEHCFVGAGAVVTRDVKPYALVVGNPARQIGWMSRHGSRLDLPLSGNGEAACPGSGERYVLRDGRCAPAP